LRPVLRRVRTLSIAGLLALVVVASAAAGWGGNDPVRNAPLGSLPLACDKAPMGRTCIDAGVYFLDKARARAGLPAYKLPANFRSLTPAQQIFVLTNLDRIQYGLPPITGLTAALNHDAVNGVQAAADPAPTSTAGLKGWTSNWAGGFANAPMAYEAWVWDDGLGSSNGNCSPSHRSACWAHRHNILWKFRRGAVLAMGAATGFAPSDHSFRAYTMLLVGGVRQGNWPRYCYTWRRAVADGAGRNAYDPRG
jgi:hypothetical protein